MTKISITFEILNQTQFEQLSSYLSMQVESYLREEHWTASCKTIREKYMGLKVNSVKGIPPAYKEVEISFDAHCQEDHRREGDGLKGLCELIKSWYKEC